jgi:hypothetical protein
MKQCRICLQNKDLVEFYPRGSSVDGYRHDCKKCCIDKSKARYRKDLEASRAWHREHHREKVKAHPSWHAEYYAKNKEVRLAYDAQYYHTKNRERRLAQVKKWAAENRGKSNAIKKAYKVAKARACPPWLTKDGHWMMYEAYELAALRTEVFGFAWHVDHEVPLRGKRVSGLHVPWNLCVIPGVENMSKSNKFVI